MIRNASARRRQPFANEFEIWVKPVDACVEHAQVHSHFMHVRANCVLRKRIGPHRVHDLNAPVFDGEVLRVIDHNIVTLWTCLSAPLGRRMLLGYVELTYACKNAWHACML